MAVLEDWKTPATAPHYHSKFDFALGLREIIFFTDGRASASTTEMASPPLMEVVTTNEVAKISLFIPETSPPRVSEGKSEIIVKFEECWGGKELKKQAIVTAIILLKLEK